MTRQVVAYLFLLVATFALTTFAYFQLRGEWVEFNKGEALYQEKRFGDAVPYYRNAIAQGVDTAVVYFHLGDSYAAEKQFPEAIALYKQYLNRHPNDSEARLRLARVYSYMGDLERASLEYQKVLEVPQSEAEK